jgi:outer membrane receptor for ferrienterochelin and colicin
MKNCKLKLIAAAVMMSLGSLSSVQAAETTSNIRGKITGPEGQVASNVKITVKHEPSGTVTEYVTNDSGVFIARGLRVGGPYTVMIDSDEFQDATHNDLYLVLGDTLRIKSQLKSEEIERIGVTASRYVETNGSSSIFGQELIDSAPSLNNDLKDIARINPMVTIRGNGEMTIAGGNPRTNSISIDGISQNDDFGLNYGGYPTGNSPISLDAVAQVAVDTAPFDVTKGGFSGGAINAVTKSGTNEFTGTMYYEFRNQDMAGSVENFTQDGTDEGGYRIYNGEMQDSNFSANRFSVSLGGPIIKDKFFVFANYEEENDTIHLDYGFEGSGAANTYNTSQENFDQFLQILQDTYGLTDSLGGDSEDQDRKWVVRFDYNINDDHRAAFTYQGTRTDDERNYGSGGFTVMLDSQRYVYQTKMDNYALRLFSDWNDDLSTEFSMSYKDVSADSITRTQLGSVTVEEFFRGPEYQFGTDRFRHANAAENQNLIIKFDANYLYGDHELKFGGEFQRLRLYNLFAENSRGSYEFDSLEGFANRELGNFQGNYDFDYWNAYTNNALDTAYDATRTTSAIYFQDNFDLTDDIAVSAGIRYERLSSNDRPTLNANFFETYGFSNQENLDGLSLLMPRVGFKWFLDEQMTVRGGIGRFYGGTPNVWFNGPFTKDGITLVQAPESVINDYFATTDQPVDLFEIPQEIRDAMQRGTGSLDYTDPNFTLPSDWRAQIAIDYEFENGYTWSNEFLYVKTKDDVVWYNTALTPLDENGSINYAADGIRIIQSSIYEGDLAQNYDIMMTNSDEGGKRAVFTTALTKFWDNGASLRTSYTNQSIVDLQAGSSSRNQSNYQYNVGVNRNEMRPARGHYEQEHVFKLTLGYETQFFEGYNTNISLYFERASGRPFSYTMGTFRDRDLGDNEEFYSSSSYLPYIPTGPDDPLVDWDYNRGMSWDELSGILDRAGIEACGCIIDRNYGTQPWVTKMDLSFKQEIPGFAEGHKGQLFVTIFNLANLLNDDWGIEKRLSFSNQNLYDFGGLSEDGKYQIERRFRGTDVRNYSYHDNASAWSVQLGVRYSF